VAPYLGPLTRRPLPFYNGLVSGCACAKEIRMSTLPGSLGRRISRAVLAVPIRVKITGLILLPILVLGVSLYYWVTTGLSDWLSYLLTAIRVEAAMRAGARSVLLVTALVSVGSLALASLLTYLVTRPILDLRKMAQKVAAGQLDARAPIWAEDEVGQLSRDVNQMTDRLLASHEALQRTNRRLVAVNRVAMVTGRDEPLPRVLDAVLAQILEALSLETGWIYLRDPDNGHFHLASSLNVPDSLSPFLVQEPRGRLCQCQEDLIAGELEPGIPVRQCQRLSQSVSPGTDTLHYTAPLAARGYNYGIINLLCQEGQCLSEDDLAILTAICAQVSERVAGAWLRMRLQQKEAARQLLLTSLVKAQEEERRRLARELHDGAGQTLTGLAVRLKALERHVASEEGLAAVGAMQDVITEAIEEVRDLSQNLRPAALDEFGLPTALETLVEEMTGGDERTGSDGDPGRSPCRGSCRVELDGLVIPPELEVVLYRIGQEALTNVVRHAAAQNVRVSLIRVRGGVCLTVEDDGCGFAPDLVEMDVKEHRLGLLSMDERAAMVGGELEIFSAPGAGTLVRVFVPLDEQAEA
jgi:signal transduction histidine kinase